MLKQTSTSTIGGERLDFGVEVARFQDSKCLRAAPALHDFGRCPAIAAIGDLEGKLRSTRPFED